MPRPFAVTWDYRCPFARNAHDHVVTALQGGADWDVRFLPFSLSQAHVADGERDVWEDPERDSGLLALQTAVAVRDLWPDRFLDVHRRLFVHRHEEGGSLRDEQQLANLLKEVHLEPDEVFAEVASGRPLRTIETEHTDHVTSHQVWGVPTFILGEHAVFVRFMHRPAGDVATATATVERVLDLAEWPELNEFKHTSIPH